MSAPHNAEYVYYNDGTNEDIYALVIKHNDDNTLNLQTIPEQGPAEVVNGIPNREKADYDDQGGGRTWHL